MICSHTVREQRQCCLLPSGYFSEYPYIKETFTPTAGFKTDMVSVSLNYYAEDIKMWIDCYSFDFFFLYIYKWLYPFQNVFGAF